MRQDPALNMHPTCPNHAISRLCNALHDLGDVLHPTVVDVARIARARGLDAKEVLHLSIALSHVGAPT